MIPPNDPPYPKGGDLGKVSPPEVSGTITRAHRAVPMFSVCLDAPRPLTGRRVALPLLTERSMRWTRRGVGRPELNRLPQGYEPRTLPLRLADHRAVTWEPRRRAKDPCAAGSARSHGMQGRATLRPIMAEPVNPPPTTDPLASLRLTIETAAREWLRLAPKAPEPLAILDALSAPPVASQR